MIHYTVLIPGRDSTDAVRSLLPRLERVLERLVLPYEIIAIDDASAITAASAWEELLSEHAHLRLLRFDQRRGTSAALSAGIAASRGDLIIAMAPDTRFSVDVISQLIARLSQHDFAVACHEETLAAELRRRVADFPRTLLASPDRRADEDLLWVADRSAVSGLALARGAFRVLPALVARRGMRVCRLTIGNGLPPQGTKLSAGVLERLAMRWLDRGYEPHLACELVPSDVAAPRLRLARTETGRVRFVPQVGLVPAEKERRDSA